MKNLRQLLQSPWAFGLSLTSTTLFGGLFIYFKTREEQAYTAAQIASLPAAKTWIVETLRYSPLVNGTCSLDYLRLSVDPWKCFNPYEPFPLNQQCELTTPRVALDYPYDPEGLIFQAAVGLFLFCGCFVAAHQSKLPSQREFAAQAKHIFGTLVYTLAISFGFPIAELFANGPLARQLGQCDTLMNTVQAVCQMVTPINSVQSHRFFPECDNMVNATYRNNLTLSDLDQIKIETDVSPLAETPLIYALSFLNMELLTCSILWMFALVIQKIIQNNNLCFPKKPESPIVYAVEEGRRAAINDDDDKPEMGEDAPLLGRKHQ